LNLPPFTWPRLLAIAFCAWVVYGSFRMVLVYKGIVRSSLGVTGSPSLIAISLQRGWVFLISLVPLLLAPWPALVTYLLGARCLGSVVSLIQCIRKVPPFDIVIPEENRFHGARVTSQAGGLVFWLALTAGSALYFGL